MPVGGHLEAPDPPGEAQRGERADEPGHDERDALRRCRMSRLTTATADNRSASGCVTSIVVGTGSEELCGGTAGRATSANSCPALAHDRLLHAAGRRRCVGDRIVGDVGGALRTRVGDDLQGVSCELLVDHDPSRSAAR